MSRWPRGMLQNVRKMKNSQNHQKILSTHCRSAAREIFHLSLRFLNAQYSLNHALVFYIEKENHAVKWNIAFT